MSKKCFLWLFVTMSFAALAMIPAYAEEPLPEPIGGEEWCARTQGFWKNHPEEWPVFDDMGIGLQYYLGATKEELIGELNQSVKQDVTYILIKQLIAAKLNVLKAPSLGAYMVDGERVDSLIEQADLALMGGALNWVQVESIKDKLDTFNNSEECGSSDPGGDIPIPS